MKKHKTPKPGDKITVYWTYDWAGEKGSRETGLMIGREGARYVITGKDGRTYIGDLTPKPGATYE